MNATLTALQGFLLALTWYAEQGTTYTVQSSPDLIDWTALPLVFSGLDGEETLALEARPSPVFVRLRANANGDTNNNGLPDSWELQAFGRLDIDATADPDGDGESTYIEWLNNTDPQDYYDGQTMRIQLSCGSDWLVQAGSRSAQCVALSLLDRSGSPVPEAPVQLRLQSGEEGLLQKGDPLNEAANEIIAFTDQLGRIHPADHAIQYAAFMSENHEEVLIIEAGKASVEIRIHVVPDAGASPPRQIKRSFLTDGGILFTWKGSADSALSFQVEEQSNSGDWTSILELASGQIPPPDPDTNLYACTIMVP